MTLPVVYTLVYLVASIALCAILNSRHIHATYPAFYRYSFFQAFASATSLVVWLLFFDLTNFWTYYILIFPSGILAFLAARELAQKLLGPEGALPAWVSIRFKTMIWTGIAAALTVSVLFKFHIGGSLTHLMVKAEQWMAGALFVTFFAILIFWRTLKVFRRQTRAASICLGFVLSYTVSILAVFVRGRGGLEMAQVAQQVGMIADIAALFWWGGLILMRAPVFKKATGEQVQQVLNEFRETQQAAIRAAVIPR